MTIVTKPLSDKKEEKGSNQEPLVGEVKVLIPEPSTSNSTKKTPYTTTDWKRVFNTFIPLCIGCGLLLILVLASTIPVVINLLKVSQLQMEMYHDWCSIPYEDMTPESSMQQADEGHNNGNNNIFDEFKKLAHIMDKTTDKFFREEFEISDAFEKITIPEFSGGRRSRFIHDFRTNKTCIIDLDGHRCFVLPLNRSAVLPPNNLMDLIRKINTGYYDVDTSILRENMRVVTPAIEDRAELGPSIMSDCYNYPIYKLEKYVSGVFKRSVNSEDGKFVVFSGKGTHELRIVNYGDLAEHEADGPIAMA